MYRGCPYAGKPFWANLFKYMFCIPMFGKECIEFLVYVLHTNVWKRNELNFLLFGNDVYDDNSDVVIIILLLNYATKRFSECDFFIFHHYLLVFFGFGS